MLAIAGLIFLMVFIAYPALRRSQRDTQRRQDMARLASAVEHYQTNNNGRLPSQQSSGKPGAEDFTITSTVTAPADSEDEGAWPTGCTETAHITSNAACNFIRTYMNASGATENEFKDPDGNSYGLTIVAGAKNYKPSTKYDRQAYIITGVQCADDGTGGVVDSNNKRDFAITFMTEGSGMYCSNG